MNPTEDRTPQRPQDPGPWHEAVRLRLDGRTLKEVSQHTGLSVPTVIAAHKRFLAGGWDMVAGRARGRRAGEGRRLDARLEAEAFRQLTTAAPDALGLPQRLWSTDAVQAFAMAQADLPLSPRTIANYLARWHLAAPRPAARLAAGGDALAPWRESVYPAILARAEREGATVLWVDETCLPGLDAEAPAAAPRPRVIRAVTPRGKLFWLGYGGWLGTRVLIDFFDRLLDSVSGKACVILDGMQWERAATMSAWLSERRDRLFSFHLPDAAGSAPVAAALAAPSAMSPQPVALGLQYQVQALAAAASQPLRHSPALPLDRPLSRLERLEAESIHVLREVVAECERPVLLYSGGKDSAVMLHLAQKAFFPSPPPFPLLHIDTGWKFRELYAYRDRAAREAGLELLVHMNAEGLARGIGPFTHGSSVHTDVMKTEALRQALERHRFDAAFGGGRRDEEKSRAKERICSFRSATHHWDPKNQRPEPWQILNTRLHRGESLRVFPLSNWTELDVWHYILQQRIAIAPLYFARPRPVVERGGALIVVDDERMPLYPGETPQMRSVRFRTLGCWPLTGAVESRADTAEAVIAEMLACRSSERQGRMIDHDQAASMEKKKQEGYF